MAPVLGRGKARKHILFAGQGTVDLGTTGRLTGESVLLGSEEITYVIFFWHWLGARQKGDSKWEKPVSAKICGFLRFPAKICGFLRFSAQICDSQIP